MTLANWIAVIGSIMGGAIGAGLALGRLEALKARVVTLERGSADKGKRLERHAEQLAVINFRLFGQRPPKPEGDTPA